MRVSGGTLCVSQTLPPTTEPCPTRTGPRIARSGVDRDARVDVRMALRPLHDAASLVVLEAARAQRDALVDLHAVADDAGFADHHAGAVIDEEEPADRGAGMDVDAGP